MTNAFSNGAYVHSSEPNYIFEDAGASFGITTDADPSSANGNVIAAQSMSGLMAANGVTWNSYQEDVQFSPDHGHTSASGTSASYTNPFNGSHQYSYAVKHDPMAFFTDSMDTPDAYRTFDQLQSDLANNTYAQFNWITPDQYNDMHTVLSGGFTYNGVHYTGDEAAIAAGDNFLSQIIPEIETGDAFRNGTGLIEIWYDESAIGDGPAYPIPEILISKDAKGNAYDVTENLTHAADTRTFEDVFGLPCSNQACQSANFSAFLQPGSLPEPEPASIALLAVGLFGTGLVRRRA